LRIAVLGGGPGGLYFAYLWKKRHPEAQIDLFEQNAAGTIAWLAGEASRWAGLHRAWMPEGAGIGRWWVSRAEATAEMLSALADPAVEPRRDVS